MIAKNHGEAAHARKPYRPKTNHEQWICKEREKKVTTAHQPKRILILGNLGYIGPVLTEHLKAAFPKATLIGYDTAFFEQCLLSTSRPAALPPPT